MGHGIAIEFALAGYDVRLHSRSEESLKRARGMIRDSLGRLRDLGRVSEQQVETVPGLVRMSTDLGEVVGDAYLVIESIYEDIDAKIELFGRLDKLCPDSDDPRQQHVELPAQQTSRGDDCDRTRSSTPTSSIRRSSCRSSRWSRRIRLRQETTRHRDGITQPRSASSRSWWNARRRASSLAAYRLALLREALWLVENEVASAEDVDIAISAGLGTAVGDGRRAPRARSRGVGPHITSCCRTCSRTSPTPTNRSCYATWSSAATLG